MVNRRKAMELVLIEGTRGGFGSASVESRELRYSEEKPQGGFDSVDINSCV